MSALTAATSADDLGALRASVRGFLEEASPEAEVRRAIESADGFDPGVWERLAGQLGVTGLVVPEEFGGSGAGFVELGVVLEETGRSLLPAPFFSTAVLGVGALLLSGDADAQQAHLPAVAAGRRRVAVAVAEGGAPWAGTLECRATAGPRGWLLEGTKDGVLDGAGADLVLVLAVADGGPALFAVDGDAAGLGRTPLRTLDLTRRQARIGFHATPATLVGQLGDGLRIAGDLLHRARAGLAAEQVGGAQRVLEMATGYASTRYQFGRPIGSFQAIKHRCADMLIDVERARAAADAALRAVDSAPGELPVAAAVASSFCSDAYFAAAASNIQVHGGIGFTWEHPAHLYYRRAKSSQLLLGSASAAREELLGYLSL
jgi:alkylation response protein AidB-like acyl-CoA dehydrogenase